MVLNDRTRWSTGPGARSAAPSHAPSRPKEPVYFLTARMAARRMLVPGSGVIMTVTVTPSRTGVPLVGGGGPAMAAVEALTRGLSAELAPHGIRVVGLRPQGMPETARIMGSFDGNDGQPVDGQCG